MQTKHYDLRACSCKRCSHLTVGTKKQAADAVAEEAFVGHFINHRYCGTLTNWEQSKRIARLKEIKRMKKMELL